MNKPFVDILGSGPPLVMIHGWGWDSRIWTPLLPELVQQYQLFLIDLPGFGKSSLLTRDYTLEALVDTLLPHIPARAAWLGWSMGGLIAYWVAIHHPERLSHLITVTSSPRFIQDLPWPGIEMLTLNKFSNQLTLDHQKTLHDFLELQLRGSPHQNELLAKLQNIIISHQPSMSALMGGLNLLGQTDLRHQLKNITCPNLHIFGQKDTIVPTSTALSLSTLLPSSRCEIFKRTGHMPFLTHESDFIFLLNQFLS